VTCTVDKGYSIQEVAKNFGLNVLDEDDNAPTSQRNEYFWNWSELKEVNFVSLVDFLILCFGINQQNNYVAMSNEGGMLEGPATVSYFLHRSSNIKL
jgi:hypothetical protein